jgi:NAD(P)H-hydrate epimerase
MARVAIPTMTKAQMDELDARLKADFVLEPIRIVEIAGYALASLARQMLDGEVGNRSVVVLAGRNMTGSGGLAAARHLLNWGAWVQILLTHRLELITDEPFLELAALEQMGAPLAWAEEGWELPPADLVIDAIAGDELRGHARGKARDLIHLANSSAAPILSLHAPSGVDADTGRAYRPHVKATATMLTMLPPVGLLGDETLPACGRLYLADAGIPLAAYAEMGLEIPPVFARNPLVPLTVVDGQVTADA